LATVVPVTTAHDESHPGRFESILDFNDLIKKYAHDEGIAVLDLESAVRANDNDRHLKQTFAQPDGNHLLDKAYIEALDKIGFELIEKLLLK
jgi:hypothetical protein